MLSFLFLLFTIVLFIEFFLAYRPSPPSLWDPPLGFFDNIQQVASCIILGCIMIIIYFLTADLSDAFYQIKPRILEAYGMSNSLQHWNEWYYRLVSCLFLHQNPAHIALNLFGIMYISFYERMVGTGRFLRVFFFSGFFATLVVSLFPSDTVLIGASGSIFGVLGAYLTDDPRLTWKHRVLAPLLFLSYVVASRLFNFTEDYDTVLGSSDLAHLFGLCGGILFATLCPSDKNGQIRYANGPLIQRS